MESNNLRLSQNDGDSTAMRMMTQAIVGATRGSTISWTSVVRQREELAIVGQVQKHLTARQGHELGIGDARRPSRRSM